MSLKTLFSRKPASSTLMDVDARILCRDGTDITLTVKIPKSTPAGKLLDTVAVKLWPHRDKTGDQFQIHSVTQRLT